MTKREIGQCMDLLKGAMRSRNQCWQFEWGHGHVPIYAGPCRHGPVEIILYVYNYMPLRQFFLAMGVTPALRNSFYWTYVVPGKMFSVYRLLLRSWYKNAPE